MSAPELFDTMPVSCPVCGDSRLYPILGKRPGDRFYIRLSCQVHGVILQLPLRAGELKRWARDVIVQSN